MRNRLRVADGDISDEEAGHILGSAKPTKSCKANSGELLGSISHDGSMVLLYMVTFTINTPPMLAYVPYMDPMGLDMESDKKLPCQRCDYENDLERITTETRLTPLLTKPWRGNLKLDFDPDKKITCHAQQKNPHESSPKIGRSMNRSIN